MLRLLEFIFVSLLVTNLFMLEMAAETFDAELAFKLLLKVTQKVAGEMAWR